MNIFNVKHGDFGVYYDTEQDYICVLDCGTTQQDLRLHTCCLTPEKLIDFESGRISSFRGTKDILISHYHGDHFKGIGAFKRYGLPFFRNMYLPYIDFDATYTNRCLYAVCLLSATAELLRIPFTLLKNYSSLFVDNYAQKYILVGRGDPLSDIRDSSGGDAEVLWPPKQIYGKSKALEEFIDKLEDALRKQDHEDAIEKTKKYFSKLKQEIQSREFSSLNTESQEKEERDINEIFNIEGPNNRKELKGAFKELKKAVKGFLDALSIIFRINNKIVWMGDVNKDVIAILKDDLKGDIEWFKLPHHGTIDISNLSIKSSKFLVSLSDGKHYGGRLYDPISPKILEKACKDNTIIVCTDGHKDCHNHFNPFSCYDYLASRMYPTSGEVYCSINTIVRIDL